MSKTTANEGAASKWVDRVRLIDPATGEIAEASGDVLGPPPERFGVQDLAKTPEELAAIEETVAALNEFLRAFCGRPAVTVPPDLIHVLSTEEFRAKVGVARPESALGKSWYGHIYLWRGWPLWLFQAVLAHELFHNIAYHWLDVRTRPETTRDGIKLPLVLERRMGLILRDPSYGTLLPHFHGLNEGATEMAAIAIRQIIARNSRLLDDEGRRSITAFNISPPLLGFTDQLVTRAAGAEAGIGDVLRRLFRDCLQGTDEFLGQLEKQLPGATEILRRTGARPEELLPAALELGFGQVAKSILPYVAAP